MLIVRDFWNRKQVKGIGRAIKLNWEQDNSAASTTSGGGGGVKEIRGEAVRLYTGIGTADSKNSIFSKQEKLAASLASELGQDLLDLYIK